MSRTAPYAQPSVGNQYIERFSDKVRMVHYGNPPFILEFWNNIDGDWSQGIEFEELRAARAMGMRLALAAAAK